MRFSTPYACRAWPLGGQGQLALAPRPERRRSAGAHGDLLRQRANATRPQPRSDAPDSGPTAPMRAEAIGRVAQNSALGLCEWQRLVFGRRHAKDVEDHRDHDVIAKDAHELDRGGIAQSRMHALEVPVAPRSLLVEFLNEAAYRSLILGSRFRHAPAMQIADGLLGNARALGL